MSKRERLNEATGPGREKLEGMRLPSTWASSAAATLLAQRSAQVTWMRSAFFQKYLNDYLKRHDAGQFITGDEEKASLSRGLADQWSLGERYVLSTPAAAALVSAAATLEDEVLPPTLPQDLPSDSGVVILPRTIYGTSMKGERVGVSAFSWGPCYAAPGVPGSFLVTWTHREADDDSRLRAMRTARTAMKQMAEGMIEEADILKRTLDADTETPEDEKEALRELVVRRKREAMQTKESIATPQYTGEYEVLDMQPMPFMHEFRVRPAASHQLREQKTVPLDAVDPDSSTMVTRLPFAFWSLVEQGLLALSPVDLSPKVERKYGKKRLPYNVTAATAPGNLDSDDLITATKVRVVREESGSVRDGFRWDLATPLGGRVH